MWMAQICMLFENVQNVQKLEIWLKNVHFGEKVVKIDLW